MKDEQIYEAAEREMDLLHDQNAELETENKRLRKALTESIDELSPLDITLHRDIVNRALEAMGYTLDDMRLYLAGELILEYE